MLKTWQDIKFIININTTKNKSINCLSVINTEETDPFVLKSSLNKFFTTVGKKMKSNIVYTLKTTQIILQIHNKAFFWTSTSPDEFEENNLVQTVFQLTFLKKHSKTFSMPIFKLVNQSFITAIFPRPWKHTSVIPIFKKANPLECTNYWHLSLISNIIKIIEKLVHKCLYHFLDQNEILHHS